MFLWYAISLAVLAWLTSVLTIGFGLYLSTRRDIQHMIDVVGGLASAFLWFMAAFGASSLERVSGGTTIVIPSTATAYLFAVFGLFMIVVAFVGTAVLMNVTDLAGMDLDRGRSD